MSSHHYILSILLLCVVPLNLEASTLNKAKKKIQEPRHSLIEKAVEKQKIDISSSYDFRMMNTIHLQPSQNFLASQHENFAQLVQDLFLQGNS